MVNEMILNRKCGIEYFLLAILVIEMVQIGRQRESIDRSIQNDAHYRLSQVDEYLFYLKMKFKFECGENVLSIYKYSNIFSTNSLFTISTCINYYLFCGE